jgi:hypothetical protein
MFKSNYTKICERFSTHRWAKSRHVLLGSLNSSFFSSKNVFNKKKDYSTNKKNTVFKKISVPVLGLLFCFMCFSILGAGLSSAATIYVAGDGSGNYNCDGTNDHIEINKALADVKNMGGGTVYLKGPNTYWIAGTLVIGANTKLTGDSTAKIKLVPKAGWSSGVPMIRGETGANNIVITGFTIDGNSENQGVSFGRGYYNLINFENSNNIEVSRMRLEWGCNDGVQIRRGSNIVLTNNDVYKMGHDAFYMLYCNKGEVAYNTVFTRTNSACRLSGGISDFKVHDNIFYSSAGSDSSTGPAIEIDKTGSSTTLSFDNIEIYNNRIHTMKGSGIWMFAAYSDNVIRAKNVHIHHNIFTNVGQHASNTGYTNAGITMQNFDNTIIENNVFDNCGHAAIKWYVWSGYVAQQNAKFTTYVRNNIIMNNAGTSSVTGSGVGIWNTQPSYATFIVQNNNFYNNKNGNTYGGGFTMSDNLNADPLCADPTNSNINARDYHLRSKAGRYSNGKWVTDSVSSPLIDAGYSGSAYSKEPSPNGGRINIGRYGNTPEASKSGSNIQDYKDNPPIANAGSDKTGTTGSVITFDASASTDDKGIISYSWDFYASNGITADATGKTVTKIYDTPGTYNVTLIVTDTSGQRSLDTLQVIITSPASGNNPPLANAGPDRTVTLGSVVNFSGIASMDDRGIISYIWDFDASDGITNEAYGIETNKTYTKRGTYIVTLIVIDTDGQKDLDTLTLTVQ